MDAKRINEERAKAAASAKQLSELEDAEQLIPTFLQDALKKAEAGLEGHHAMSMNQANPVGRRMFTLLTAMGHSVCWSRGGDSLIIRFVQPEPDPPAFMIEKYPSEEFTSSSDEENEELYEDICKPPNFWQRIGLGRH